MPTTLTPAGPGHLALTAVTPVASNTPPAGSAGPGYSNFRASTATAGHVGLTAVSPVSSSSPPPGVAGTGIWMFQAVTTLQGAAAYQTGLVGSLGLAGVRTVIDAEVPADPPPAGLAEQVITRVSETYAAPALDPTTGAPAQDWSPTSVVGGTVGVLHVFFGRHDRTYFRGARTQIEAFEVMDPFGCGPARFRLPRVTAAERIGAGALGWLAAGVSVDVHLVSGGGGRWVLWSGTVTGFAPDGASSGGAGLVVECVGDLATGAMLQHHKPRQYVPLTDRGTLIARALNEEVASSRIGPIYSTTTGHTTTERGSSDQMVQEYVQAVLPAGWTVGRTDAQRVYQLRQRGAAGHTHRWTVRALQRGVDVSLRQDYTQAPNLIFGRGVNASGYAWANWRYPGQGGTSQPAYPMSSPGVTMGVGLTDAGTATGTGVSDLQARINELDLSGDVVVDGSYGASTAAAVRDVQHHLGIAEDGIVGPQTWNALWPLYTTDELDAAVRLSLAGDNRVVPYSYAADGTVLGANPRYDAGILRVERDEQMGSGISKAVGISSASDEYTRTRRGGEAYPGWVGTITLRADPREGSRFRVTEEDEIQVLGWNGTDDPVLHVAGVQFAPEQGAGEVTLTVDELYRDLPTVQAVIHQDEDSRDDPLRLPGRRARRGQLNPDVAEPFDGESRAGVVPSLPLFAGLWTVQAIPVSAAGKIARITLATSPACAFYVALFGDRVSAAQLVKYVGNPTATDSYGRGPYQAQQDKLAQLGFVDAVGGPAQAAGYSPGQQTSPWDGASSSPLTGRLDSTAPISYRSARPPWIWVAMYAAASCRISGRILPGPLED